MNNTGNKNLSFSKMKFLFFPVFFLFLCSPLLSFSQTTKTVEGKKVTIKHADALEVDERIGNGAKRLIGHVEFQHENVLMFCDSAYFYTDNSLDAFGHIHIQQPDDSTDLYGDLLNYNGNTKKAILTNNVVLDKKDMHLTTDVLNYNTSTRIAYYETPGRIVNKENILTSDHGYFFGKTDDLTFKKNVVLTNPQFVINCDTMRYNTNSKITYFKGPTTIKSKENLIYCEDGWYDTQKDLSRFSKNSYIITQQQKMFGDSVFYDRNKGQGRAVHHVQLIDTIQRITITGDIATHNEFTDLSIVTGTALMMQMSEKDTLFLHADTLKSIGGHPKPKKDEPVRNDTLAKKETALQKSTPAKKDKKNKKNPPEKNDLPVKNTAVSKSDTVYAATDTSQRLFAYHHVKFFRKDLQGRCDSMAYNATDSTMRLYGTPTLWSETNQLTSDSMWIVIGQKSLRSIELFGTAFIASQEDSLRFNQIRGKYMKGFFKNNDLFRVNVVGNGQTIYYAKEEKKIKAVNRADCTDLHIFLKNNQIDRITFVTKPDATLFPLNKIDVKELKLKDFSWRAHLRPASQKDIFTW
jgi:lipopolysaccharide export system protein LptA